MISSSSTMGVGERSEQEELPQAKDKFVLLVPLKRKAVKFL